MLHRKNRLYDTGYEPKSRFGLLIIVLKYEKESNQTINV